MFIRPILVFISFIALSTPGHPADSFAALSSPRLNIYSHELGLQLPHQATLPIWPNDFMEGVFSWVPDTKPSKYTSLCSPQNIKERLSQEKASSILHDCEKDWRKFNQHLFYHARKMLEIYYNVEQHPLGRIVQIDLSPEVKLRGLLLLKDTTKRRPLIIVRLGVFGRIRGFIAERFLLYQLFDEADFNVLVIANNTSNDYVLDNKTYGYGGFEEGIQNLLLAKLLRNPTEPLSRLVESVHLVGISMGGNGALFAGLMNELNSPPQGPPLISSIVGLCPLVRIKQTDEHYRNNFFRRIILDFWLSRRSQALVNKYPELAEKAKDSVLFFENFSSQITQAYQGPLIKDHGLRFPEGFPSFPISFYDSVDFWQYFTKFNTPLMILSTEVDPVVPPELNSDWLFNESGMDMGKQASYFKLSKGFHCSLPLAYDWQALGTLLREFILLRSNRNF